MNVNPVNLKIAALSLSMLLLAACGGGGGEGVPAVGLRVTATDPPDTAVGASLTGALGVTFSAPVDAATVNVDSFTLTGPAGPVDGTVTVVGPTAATFTPTSALAFNRDYTARLTTAIKDTAGNPLAAEHVWTFNTGAKLAASESHTCARLDNGQLKCWGRNNTGQLGLGDGTTRGDGPNEMGDDLPAVDLGSGRTAVQIVAGAFYTCARLDNGQVKCWGDNVFGQLGLGDVDDRGDQAGEMGDSLPAVDLGD